MAFGFFFSYILLFLGQGISIYLCLSVELKIFIQMERLVFEDRFIRN